MLNLNRKGIALLITVFFVMAITVAIGIGLKQVKEASWHVENERFMLQTSVIVDDVMKILQNSKELEQILSENSNEGLFAFLSSASFIPFESSGVKVSIEIKSARSKFNPNALMDANNTANIPRVNLLKEYMNRSMVNVAYVDILLDIMGKVKEDGLYNSGIFKEKPSLFRDYLTSQKHLEEVNDFYKKTYHDNSLENIDFKNLFYFAKETSHKIDVNYATPQIWELILSCDKNRAEQLSMGGGFYNTLEDLDLSDEEKVALAKFNTGYFEPYLDVLVNISQDTQSAKIEFEYDISTKKGSNFVYEI